MLFAKGAHPEEWTKPDEGQGLISWEDTVMKAEEMAEILMKATKDKNRTKTFELLCLEAQAKLAFPTGEKQGYEKGRREERANWVTRGNGLLKEHPIAGAFWEELALKTILGDI